MTNNKQMWSKENILSREKVLQNDVRVKHLITLNTFCGLSSVKGGYNNCRDGLDLQHERRVLVFPSGNALKQVSAKMWLHSLCSQAFWQNNRLHSVFSLLHIFKSNVNIFFFMMNKGWRIFVFHFILNDRLFVVSQLSFNSDTKQTFVRTICLGHIFVSVCHLSIIRGAVIAVEPPTYLYKSEQTSSVLLHPGMYGRICMSIKSCSSIGTYILSPHQQAPLSVGLFFR